jgi:hypothetical protein
MQAQLMNIVIHNTTLICDMICDNALLCDNITAAHNITAAALQSQAWWHRGLMTHGSKCAGSSTKVFC